MKLNKKLCKRCRDKAFAAGAAPRWNEFNEAEWQYRFVWCPVNLVRDFGSAMASRCAKSFSLRLRRKTDQPPPGWCPYAVEHIAEYAYKNGRKDP